MATKRNRMVRWVGRSAGASLSGLAALLLLLSPGPLAVAGGDDGLEILPFGYGGGSDEQGPSGTHQSFEVVGEGEDYREIRIRSTSAAVVVQRTPGTIAGPSDLVIDLKQRRRLGLGSTSQVAAAAGRFSLHDVKPEDEEAIWLQAAAGERAQVAILFGSRRDRRGDILDSFVRIDRVFAFASPTASVNLTSYRNSISESLGFFAIDVAVVIVSESGARAVATWDLRDMETRYEVDTDLNR